MAQFQLSSRATGERVLAELDQVQKAAQKLPAPWRLAVHETQRILMAAKRTLDAAHNELEQGGYDASERLKRLEAIIDATYAAWAPAYHQHLTQLHEMSTTLSPEATELARAYATQELLPLLQPCPIHHRAHAKPRGYAGDYRLMMLYVREQHEGPSLYGKFLHKVSQNYTLGRAVVGRVDLLRDAVAAAVSQKTESNKPVRVVSIASGPAVELRNWLHGLVELDRPVELVLVDQDDEALEYAHGLLNEQLIDVHRGRLPVDLRCTHFSVRQILKPRNAEETTMAELAFHDADLIYTSGLYDYLPMPVAVALTRRLYEWTRPGGRLLLGNLREAPDTSWIMDYVVSWHLQYRTPPDMLAMADGLSPKPSRIDVTIDDSEHCLFLDIVRGS